MHKVKSLASQPSPYCGLLFPGGVAKIDCNHIPGRPGIVKLLLQNRVFLNYLTATSDTAEQYKVVMGSLPPRKPLRPSQVFV